MVIGVDGNDANVLYKVGVSVYTYNLLKYFRSKASSGTRFTVFLRKPPFSGMPEENDFFRYRIVWGPFLWSRIFMPAELLLKSRVDVFFSPAHYSPQFLLSPLVVTIHDLAYLYFPKEFLKKDMYKLTRWTADSVYKASRIIAVSKNTKRDLVKFYNLPEEKISVVYNGFEKTVKTETPWEDITKKYGIKKGSYILYIGTLQPRKNLPALIEGFVKFHRENPQMKLIIAGKKGWLYESVFAKIAESGLDDAVLTPGYIVDEEIITLYKNAYCFVLPSFYEGFGVPLLEAMAYSCPVISSFTSSLPEVGGEACIYFDPEKPDGLYDDLQSLKNADLRKELIKKGRERVTAFSWLKCGEETLHILKEYGNKDHS